jgi:hypothetical protein
MTISGLLEVAVHVGIRAIDFWELTPAEINIYVKIFNKKIKQEHEDRITMAYLGAYWQRVKKMPSLKEVLGESNAGSKDQDASAMLEVVKRLNMAMGGTVY